MSSIHTFKYCVIKLRHTYTQRENTKYLKLEIKASSVSPPDSAKGAPIATWAMPLHSVCIYDSALRTGRIPTLPETLSQILALLLLGGGGPVSCGHSRGHPSGR